MKFSVYASQCSKWRKRSSSLRLWFCWYIEAVIAFIFLFSCNDAKVLKMMSSVSTHFCNLANVLCEMAFPHGVFIWEQLELPSGIVSCWDDKTPRTANFILVWQLNFMWQKSWLETDANCFRVWPLHYFPTSKFLQVMVIIDQGEWSGNSSSSQTKLFDRRLYLC